MAGYRTGVPGLLVSPPYDRPGYRIVHVRSGMPLAWGFDSPEAALAASQMLRPLADWTWTGTEIQDHVRRPDIAASVREVIDRFCGEASSGVDPAAESLQMDNGVIA